ncbi:MAG: BON domain-containing protein [Gammaproteobacteria bacterium]|nr:MAG: BON domain-containing protein [Gammaproteobacteria bacterium]RLA21754.1 MAG: BON domain-containing protein [Gammaproteobacteria bacterium]
MKIFSFILVIITLLSGCTAAIIGGAAVGVSTFHDRRSTGTILDDQTIELKALTQIFNNERISDNTHINVTAYNGVVLLTGEAPSEVLRSKVISLIRPVSKVRKIHNEIRLAAPSTMMARSNDSYITSKAKVALFKIRGMRDFDPSRVKVVTEDGTVYLMGLLWHVESQPVTETIRRVKGVQRVVTLFEYID